MIKVDFIKKMNGLPVKSIKNVLSLLEDDATIPFISRYRKEMTGGMDEVQVGTIRDEGKRFDDVISRQKTIISAIYEQGKLTTNLSNSIESCFDLTLLEDLYLPYKVKRLTKGEKARKLGLEPLAKMIMSQRGGSPIQMSSPFLKGDVVDEDAAIGGAKDIMAEWINENTSLRANLRQLFERKSTLKSKLIKGKDSEGEKYKDYFDHSESLRRCASHRFLALYRANREGFVSLKARPEDEDALDEIERFFVKGNDECGLLVQEACSEAYKRLLRPSLENEVLNIVFA